MLENLPSELVSEIVSHLSYKDVNSFRQALTREDLRNATDAHVVWLNFAMQYLSENNHSYFPNMQSLSGLTTNQLREQFEKRVVVNDIWRLSEQIYPSIKRFRYPPGKRIKTIKIAPGGRWAFGGTDYRTLYYWDLDSEDPQPLLLAPCDGVGRFPGRYCEAAEIDIAVESGTPLSGFVVAFVGRDWYYRPSGKSHEWLYICDVAPQENGTLKVKRLRTVPLPYDGFCPLLSFNEHLAARYMKKRVDVYWWKECTETHLVRCTLAFEKDITIVNIYVLGSDKLLVFQSYDGLKARLYALEPECSEIGEYRKVVSRATLIWKFHFRCNYNYAADISRLYFDGTNYRQVIAAFDGIYGLVIPASQFHEPIFMKISDFTLHNNLNGYIYGLGLNKGYVRVDQQLYRLGYSWGPIIGSYENEATSDSNLDRLLRFLEKWSNSFDEESGRLVSLSWHYLVFQDFSLPLYNVADVCPG